jgi:hypothetical protein
MAKNLWGDLSQLEAIRSPKAVLLEQAQLLTDATKGVLVGVVGEREEYGDNFGYDLDVTVPTLNNYSYTVLTIRHSLDLYPVAIAARRPPKDLTCDNEQDFERALEAILGSAEVKDVLARLRSQAT